MKLQGTPYHMERYETNMYYNETKYIEIEET